MSHDLGRWKRVKRVFQDALNHAPAERAAFLAAACGDDADLLGAVERLLVADEQAGSFAESPVITLVASGEIAAIDRGLHPGDELGPYRIDAWLGTGGMGAVYKAHDTRLGRTVAIKILHPSVQDDRDLTQRFAREARTLAALNHPHICTVFDVGRLAPSVGTQPAMDYLVMEYVDGRTLAEQLARGAMPVKEALAIATQITDALDAAHEQGIVHRDLKPTNIMLQSARPSSGDSPMRWSGGTVVKVLDFGLAKTTAVARPGSASNQEVAESDRHEAGVTSEGLILGTAQYMSPEQARGHALDKRVDVWAFGCVLYEMITGQPAFGGETLSDTIAAVLDREPSWSALPATTPGPIRRLLPRCLEKDLGRRWRDIGDARIEIEAALTVPTADGTVPQVGETSRRTLWWVAAALLLSTTAGGVLAWHLKPASTLAGRTPPVVERLQIAPVERLAESDGVITVSPDGRRIAYAAETAGRRHLYVREIDQFDSKAVPGTDGVSQAAFSPDGQSLVFVADRTMKKVTLAGGTPITLRESVEGAGLSWTSEQTILFGPGSATGIWRMSADGSTSTAATSIGNLITRTISGSLTEWQSRSFQLDGNLPARGVRSIARDPAEEAPY